MENKFNHKQKTTLIGISTISAVLMLYFGINYLKGLNIFDRNVSYYATCDNIQGVSRSTGVFLNGFKVGNVRDIDFDYKGYNGAVLVFSLDHNLKVPVGTKAVIKNNPLGGGAVNLILPDQISGHITKRDTIVCEQATDFMASLTDVLIPNLNAAVLSIDSLSVSIKDLVEDPNISETLAQINASSRSIQSATLQLSRMMGNQVPKILDEVEQSSQAIRSVTAKVDGADIEKTLADFSQVVGELKAVSQQLNSKENSFGLLLNDKGLYDKLDSAVLSADSLLKDIQQNPKRYVSFSVF